MTQPNFSIAEPRPKRTAYARKNDMARFSAAAQRGDIEAKAVAPLAVIFAACRDAQTTLGPGHLPLDTLLDALPDAYVENCLRKRAKRARMQ